MNELLNLADRVESADPNDWRALRTLAKDIYRELNELPTLVTGGYGWQEDESGWWLQTGEDQRCPRKRIDPPNWLASLDAAMSLLTGCATLISLSEIGADGMPLARVGRPDLDDVPIFEGGAFGVRMDTPLTAQLAIALTAACLKARAHSLPSANEAGR